jgi:MinD superfamily P-loop ATPase
MQQIAITGGKGGTGKSSFAILLALKLSREGKRVVLCDADVECPNDYLILGTKQNSPEAIYQDYPEIDADKCTRCGKCVESCRFNAMFRVGDEPQVVKNLCCGCGLCWAICPAGAISVKREPCGASFVDAVSERLWLVTGRSLPGIEETGPIVRDTKARALELAEKVGADFLLVDTAAGTHCSVINALIGSELAYLVAEPTPLGVHDSGIMLDLLKIIGIPSEIVLNKSGIARDELIEGMAKTREVKIAYRVPYSEELVKAYSNRDMDRLNII